MTRICRLVSYAALLCAGVLAAGCRTMEGLGEDIERGGEKLQDAAD